MSHHELPRRRHVHHHRHAESTPRRRKADPPIRRRQEDHKKANGGFGVFFIVAVAVLFLAYVFNVQGFATAADSFFTNLNTAGHSHDAEVVSLFTAGLPILGLMIGALVLLAVVRWVIGGAKHATKKRKLAGRQVITVEHFREVAVARGIRPRIANHAYTLLLPYYHEHMRVRLDDGLREELHMTETQINNLLGDLLFKTDRKPRVGTSAPVSTVMELMQSVQDSPRAYLHDTGVHGAAGAHKPSVIRPAARQIKPSGSDGPLPV